jgi:pSer/pThr/pTyr-binding forkhead associated (FHA) protein
MEVKLVVAQGSQAGQEVPIPGRKFFIGRAEDCHLRPHSDLISRHHCVILVEDAFVAVRDFGSKNGTFVNGQRITSEVELKPGDNLKVGQLEFKVHMDVGVGGKKLPKVHSVQEAAVRTAQPPRPQKAAKDDMDVADWLSDDEAHPMSDTATMDPTQAMGKSRSTSENASAASPSRE